MATLIVEDGKINALLYVCVVVSSAVFLKNLFIYLSTLFVSILLNRSVGDMRNNIYQTLMHLPVAYLSDERKGDVISMISNDVQEIESSIQSAIRGIFKDPINVTVFLITLFAMSLELSIFIIFFLPITGLLISLISKTLRKNTKSAQDFFHNLIAHI